MPTLAREDVTFETSMQKIGEQRVLPETGAKGKVWDLGIGQTSLNTVLTTTPTVTTQ